MRTHPLPPWPPDSGASFSSFGVFVFDLGCFVFEFWVFRFRSRVLRFRDLGVFVFDLGCFVFEFWVFRFRSRVLRFRDLGTSCFGLRFRVLRFRNYQSNRDCSPCSNQVRSTRAEFSFIKASFQESEHDDDSFRFLKYRMSVSPLGSAAR